MLNGKKVGIALIAEIIIAIIIVKSTTWTKTDQLIIQWIDSSYQLWK